MAMRVGEGRHVYEWVGDWARLPEGSAFGYTHGVVCDRDDNVYVHNRSRDAVAVFDRDGRFLDSWGQAFAGGAHGCYLSLEGGAERLYLADPERHLVVQTTLDGRELWSAGVPPLPDVYGSEAEYRPTDACVAPGGDVYVCDGYGKSWVHRYTTDGSYVSSFGGKGAGPGQLDCPHGIWVDTRGAVPRLLVADRGNRRLQAFDLDGRHLGFIHSGLRQPCCMYQFEGDLYVPDLHGRLTVLGPDDTAAAQVGDDPGVWQRAGWPNVPAADRVAGRFVSPHAACVDSRGDVYVVEWIADGRVTKLVRA